MSLVRTALRFAAIAALEADPVVAALCPGRVFDSRIDAIDAKDPVPVVVVFTEDDKGSAYSVNNGGPPFDHSCDLLIEISLRVMVPATDDADETDIAIACPETDAEAEATLDLLEEAAINAITVAETPQAALIRSAVLRRVTEFKSIRFATPDAGSKLALRAVSLTAHLKVNQPSVLDVPTGAFAALPDPLRTVAASLPTNSAAYAVCAGLAARMSAPAAPTLLAGVDFAFVPYRGTVPPLAGDVTAADPVTTSLDLACPISPSANS